MRSAAFLLLTFAAFDWPVPWLDRVGAALLGGGFLALGAGVATFTRRARSLPVPAKRVQLPNSGDEGLEPEALARVLAFGHLADE